MCLSYQRVLLVCACTCVCVCVYTEVQRLELVASGVAIAALSSAPALPLRIYPPLPPPLPRATLLEIRVMQHPLHAWPDATLMQH